ncbi:MAG: pantetheine-phosphate adenylyltransferase [Bacteroidota bacterium]
MPLALYAGTFDPVTLGHVDVIARTLALFERVEVTVAVNASKRTLFSAKERTALIRESTADLEGADRLAVSQFEGLLVDHARTIGARVLVRGIRGPADFDYEMRMAMANRHLASGLETVFLAPDAALQFVSSSIVRDVHRWGGDTAGFVPEAVQRALGARR